MEHEFQIIMPELDVSGNKRLEKIKQKLIKKMSFNSSKDLTTLRDLFYWVYIYNYSEKFTQLYPLGLSLEFNGNRNLWTPCIWRHLLWQNFYRGRAKDGSFGYF